jgi:hypothetical protein
LECWRRVSNAVRSYRWYAIHARFSQMASWFSREILVVKMLIVSASLCEERLLIAYLFDSEHARRREPRL